MIALPVLSVTAADVVIQTGQIAGAEALERRLGAADARVDFSGSARAQQTPDPDLGNSLARGKATTAPTMATISDALGRPVRGLEQHKGSVRVSTDKGVASAEATEIDLRDPLAAGLFELTQGRLPSESGEVVVNAALAARGPGLGETIRVGDDMTVVGIAESTSARNYPIVVGQPGGKPRHRYGPADVAGGR